MQAPVLVLNTNAKRESGRKAQLGNIAAAKTVADIVRTTLGPRSMLKMLLDPMGGIVITNDGNAILREIDVSHPAAKSMIELSRTQDEEVGDGTTSVIILAGELLAQAEQYLASAHSLHPRDIVGAYIRAMDTALAVLDRISAPLDISDRAGLLTLVRSCLGTKFVSRFGDLVCNLALDAVQTITVDRPNLLSSNSTDGTAPSAAAIANAFKEVDIKRYARVEKLPGGYLEDSTVLKGVMLNKDVVSAGMRRHIVNPRILLLDCNLEFKKAESQTNLELQNEADFERVLKMEEEYIERVCKHIIALKPDLVFTEKGVSDLAAHFLQKANIAVIRRIRKTDNNRIARAVGATICSIAEEVKEEDLGTECGLFEVRKIGDEYFTFLIDCKKPKACTILLRGGSKDVLNEIERNLLDAMNVVRNIIFDPRIVPGGGACEMAIAHEILVTGKSVDGKQQYPYKSVAAALEVIPRTLIENCGGSAIRLLTDLRAKHANGQTTFGIDGNKGEVTEMRTLGIVEPLAVKQQTIKTAIESACMLLRIDDIVSGMRNQGGGGGAGGNPEQDEETFGDARDG